VTGALLTPLTHDLATRVGPRLFRKQLLPLGSLTYEGRRLDFTTDYLASLAASFRDRAYDSVKFLLAGDDNRHTLDPERMRGTLRGLQVTPEGLDGILELSDDAAALVDEHPDLGVSVRIVEGLEKADGRKFPAAINHVLGTLDPKVTGMRPWQAVDLSNDTTPTVDLTGATFTTQKEPLMPDTAEALREQIAGLGDDERAALLASLAELTATVTDPAAATSTTTAATTTVTEPKLNAAEPLTDEQLAAAVAKLLEEEPAATELAGAGAALSTEAQAAIDLANAAREEDRKALDEVRTDLAASHWREEKQRLLQAGVPKVVLDLAEPVLSLPAGVIDLSNSTGPDPIDALRKVVDACKGTVDLSVIGSIEGDDDTETRAKAVEAYAEHYKL
jgi:hypothetical protein